MRLLMVIVKRLSKAVLGSVRSQALQLDEWKKFSLRQRQDFVRTRSLKSENIILLYSTTQRSALWRQMGNSNLGGQGERCLPVEQLALYIPCLRTVQWGVHVSGFQVFCVIFMYGVVFLTITSLLEPPQVPAPLKCL